MSAHEWLNVAKALRFIEREQFDAALPNLEATERRTAWALFKDRPEWWLFRQSDADAAAILALAGCEP